MSKRVKLIIILIIIAVGAVAAFYFLGSRERLTKNLSEITMPVQNEIVRGADLGEWGNDRDGVFSGLAVSPDDPDFVLAGSEGNAVFKSVDGGQTWTWPRQGFKTVSGYYPEVYDILIDPNNSQIVYVAFTGGPCPSDWKQCQAAGVFKSTDGGDSWQQLNEGLPNTAAISLAIDPSDTQTLYVGLDGGRLTFDSGETDIPNPEGGIYKTANGGDSWQALPTPEKGLTNRYREIRIPAGQPDTIITGGVFWGEPEERVNGQPPADQSVGLVKSTDGGQTWQDINPVPNAFIKDFDVAADGQTIYASDIMAGQMYVSTDGGASWQNLPGPSGTFIRIAPDDPQKVFIANYDGLNFSTDGLKTSHSVLRLESNEGRNQIEAIEISPADPNIVYAYAAGLLLLRSDDGGQTFAEIANLRKFVDSQPE